jgi:ABC-type transport system substrate-binding protein
LTDFVAGASAVLTKNQNYWQNDERYPQNKIPYLDSIKVLIIPDDATAQAALRSGKIDALEAMNYVSAQSIQKTNPGLIPVSLPGTSNISLDPRNDVKPFNDIKVRIAMQKAIDLQSIAKSYYHGLTSGDPASMTGNNVKGGWAFPYSDWSDELKATYSYDPAAAKKMLADAGYPAGFKTNIVASTAVDPDLLQIVKSYFLAVGIDMEIRQMDPTSWTNFVWTTKKEDQLSTRGGGALGQISEPLSQWIFLKNSTGANTEFINDPIYEAAYIKATTATDVATTKQTMRDINKYVAEQHWAICLLVENLYGAYNPWLKGYYGQFDAIACGAVGPHLLGFYCSRFWIDQDLKKSMGH